MGWSRWWIFWRRPGGTWGRQMNDDYFCDEARACNGDELSSEIPTFQFEWRLAWQYLGYHIFQEMGYRKAIRDSIKFSIRCACSFLSTGSPSLLFGVQAASCLSVWFSRCCTRSHWDHHSIRYLISSWRLCHLCPRHCSSSSDPSTICTLGLTINPWALPSARSRFWSTTLASFQIIASESLIDDCFSFFSSSGTHSSSQFDPGPPSLSTFTPLLSLYFVHFSKSRPPFLKSHRIPQPTFHHPSWTLLSRSSPAWWAPFHPSIRFLRVC